MGEWVGGCSAVGGLTCLVAQFRHTPAPNAYPSPPSPVHQGGDWLIGGEIELLDRIRYNDGLDQVSPVSPLSSPCLAPIL